MSAATPDISVVVFASREGHLLHGSILSVERAIKEARKTGLTIDALVAAYAPDRSTSAWLAERSPYRSVKIAKPCLGNARNFALEKTKGRAVAFLDGGDLWSRNFLVEAENHNQSSKRNVVWRPATSIGFADDYFDSSRYSVRPIPDSADLPPSSILVANPYPSTFFARREILKAIPFPVEDQARGWNEVDWWWNANLLGHDVELRTVPETLHYFRTSMAEERQRARGPGRLGPTALELGRRRRG